MSTLHPQFSTFSECKAFVFEAINDPNDLVVDDVCLLKIVQAGIMIPFSWKSWVDLGAFAAVMSEGIQKKESQQLSAELQRARVEVDSKSILAVDLNRFTKANKSKHLGPYLSALKGKAVAHFVSGSNIDYPKGSCPSPASTKRFPFLLSEAKFAWRVYRKLARLCAKNGKLLPFKASIFRSAQLFLREWCAWKRVLEGSNIQTCLLVCHYHNEGLIHACRGLGIEVIEVQHGIILESSMFYVYPHDWRHVLNNALFPDQIHVFGSFWKEQLLKGSEFNPSQIHIVGDVLGESVKKEDSTTRQPNRLLVCSQTGLAPILRGYLHWLIRDCQEKNMPFSIVIKPHPSERGDEYKNICSLSTNVVVSNQALPELLQAANSHLTVFSMTLFAALSSGTRNFSVHYAGRSDFQQEIADAGVSRFVKSGTNFFVAEHDERVQAPDPTRFLADLIPQNRLLQLITIS